MKFTSLSTLVACLLSAGSAFAQSSPPDRPDMGPPPSFSDMDNNGDGVLTSDELEGPISNDFSQIDQNGDGAITQAELDEFMQNHKPPMPPRNND